MSTVYNIVYSDMKDKPVSHLPVTAKRNYRLLSRVMIDAHALHRQNRDVVVIERNQDGIVATWEYEAGSDRLVFWCDETLLKQED